MNYFKFLGKKNRIIQMKMFSNLITKVAMFSTKKYDREYFKSNICENKSKLAITYIEEQLNENTYIMAQDHSIICVFVNDRLNSEVLIKLSELNIKKIVLRCAGFNNINLEKAKELNFRIVRVPAYSPHSVAEHAVCLMLALNRKLKKSIDRSRDLNFELDGLLGFDMNGKTVGVIGTGRIGLILIKILLGFGCKVICCDPFKNPEVESLGLPYVDLNTIYKESDIISLHCFLNNETFHTINEKAINQMKKGVMIINTSRGALIDTHAVILGLKSGQVGYLGIDVIEHEEDVFFSDLSDSVIQNDEIARLLVFNNVIITAHQAFFTKEAINNIALTTIENIICLAEDKVCKNQIN